MAYRELEVTLLSAKDLKRVNLITPMEVYAVVTISGDPLTRQCTPTDPYGGRHPSWHNATFRFNVPPTAAAASGCLHVLLRTERAFGDRDVGEVIVPLADILAGAASSCDPGPRPPQRASYQVRKVHRCEPRGTLNVSYRLGAVVAPQQPPPPPPPPPARPGEHLPVVAYPVPGSYYAPPYAYYIPPPLSLPPAAPQAAAGGHGAMHTPAPSAAPINTYSMPAAYPQAAAGGYAALPPAKGKRDDKLEFGMALGAGLVGGAFAGGMLAGDMMSDVAAYNSGYRAGLVDGGVAMYKMSHVPQVHDKGVAKAQNKGEQNRTMA
ncbi:hypothetical protein ACP4OV_007149 [Aristida adscensionis]